MSSNICRRGSVVVLIVVALALSSPLVAQEQESSSAEAEMEEALGVVPVMMKVFPDHLRTAAWDLMKARQSPDAAIPGKYSELISLGVASQIPCNYCVYFHTEMAKMSGATEAEIKEAVASAADTRHWSTVLNGAVVDFAGFKAEVDGMVAHIEAQMAAKQTSDE